MNAPSPIGAMLRSDRLRSWAIGILIVLIAFELVYVVAANYLIRTGTLSRLINTKPEKTHISWEAATTWLPGYVSVTGFALRSQTKKNQIYLTVAEADARISLHKLAFKTIHIRGVDAREVDFRYRERLDRPPKKGEEEGPPPDTEYWPEIPGYSNPPDPRPEDLYPMKKKRRPWTIAITGAEVKGPVSSALGAVRIEGDGLVGGGVTVKPRRTVTIHRGRLELDPATVTIGPDVVTDDFTIAADLRFEPFPAKGARLADVLAGISGKLTYSGRLSEKVATQHVITPGLVVSGTGDVAADLRFRKGSLRAPSQLSLESNVFRVTVMGLEATGSAKVVAGTEKERGEHVTSTQISLGEFRFVNPQDQSVDITGSGLKVDARWNNLVLGDYRPASLVQILLPRTRIRDVSAFNQLIPGEQGLVLESGTGDVEAKLEVRDRVAAGTIDLVAEKIAFKSVDASLIGDLEVHANLEQGELESRRFNLSGTTIRLDHIADEALSEKRQAKLDEWFCDLSLRQGVVTFGRPIAATGALEVGMLDTRPLVGLLKEFGVTSKALSMMPNVKDINGEMNLDFGRSHFRVEDLMLTGKGLEVLGWLHVRDKKPDARLLIDYSILTTGVALDRGKAKVHLAKPRKWYENNAVPPSR